jgi:zinc/manganese transport system substrate-binding protein
LAIVVVLMGAGAAVSACTSSSSAAPTADGRLVAVGAENQYADVISQIGGRYVTTSAVLSNPNTDPHTFESSPQVAEEVGAADLIVQNGVGYDTFMNKIESASANPRRRVIDVQTLLGLPDSTPNPHLWYKPSTMPAVAAAIGRDLSSLQPDHAAYFAANVTRFDASLDPWYRAIASFKAKYPGVPVATTEPVGDYLLEAAGTRNLTPFTFQADIMNGLDPSPQDVSIQTALFTGHKVKVFVYNQQVTDALTQSLLTLARQHHIPVVGVYETMPTPGYHYQSWMVAEVDALQAAVAHGTSSPKL